MGVCPHEKCAAAEGIQPSAICGVARSFYAFSHLQLALSASSPDSIPWEFREARLIE